MEKGVRKRLPSEILKRGYSDEEVSHIFALVRLYLEAGLLRKAQTILNGLTNVASDFDLAWMALSYISMQYGKWEQAAEESKRAYEMNPNNTGALLYLIACLLTLKDFQSAGTYLGEVAERIEAGISETTEIVRFYNIQLTRYQYRN